MLIIIYTLEDIDNPGNDEGIDEVVSRLNISSNVVGESAAECQGCDDLTCIVIVIISLV